MEEAEMRGFACSRATLDSSRRRDSSKREDSWVSVVDKETLAASRDERSEENEEEILSLFKGLKFSGEFLEFESESLVFRLK